MSRKLLGVVNGAATRQRVYRIDDGVEVDDIDHFEVTRRRVFFDEVVSVTRHKQIGVAFVVVFLLLAGFFLTMAIVTREETGVAVFFLILAALFGLPAALRLLLKIDVITMHGRRTRAVMHFWMRKRRAQRVYDELVRESELAQQRIAAENARAQQRPVAPEFELPPTL